MGKNGERTVFAASDEITQALETEKPQVSVKSAAASEQTAAKKRFRAAALSARDSLTPEQRKRYSDKIIKNLISLPCYQEADTILTYISFRSEVDTFPLLEQAFADKKAVFAPKVFGKEMAFYRIFSREDLAAGYQGILEPVGGMLFETWKNDQTSQHVLICLPGAAFDRSCHRIGYGGGFYDRYLSRLLQDRDSIGAGTFLQTETDAAAHSRKGTDTVCPQMKYFTAGLSFSCQIFEEIPWETHDIRPERIITQTEIIRW